jgi:hypothetical protein
MSSSASPMKAMLTRPIIVNINGLGYLGWDICLKEQI